MENLVEKLQELVLKYNFETQSIEGAKFWAKSDDFNIDNSITNQFEYSMDSQRLVFEHDYKATPYIEVMLNIELDEEYVGYYCMTFDLDGSCTDDMMVIKCTELINS